MRPVPVRTHAQITIKLLNPNGKHRTYDSQAFDIPLIPAENLPTAADKAMRAACEALGNKLHKLEIPK